MGLDSFLSAKVFVGAEYEHRKVNGTIEIFAKGKRVDFGLKNLSELVYNVAYWRKANHIHKWFVDNTQNGEDDCRETYVSREALEELLEACNKVLNNKEAAEEVLPTESGFFFGSTEYDEYYYKDFEETVDMITKAIKDFPTASFYYKASW